MSRIQLGRVLESKSGNFRIELGQPRDKEGNLVGKNKQSVFPITLNNGEVLNEGDFLILRSPRQAIDGLVKANLLSAEVAETRKASIPAFIKYNVELDTEYGRNK